MSDITEFTAADRQLIANPGWQQIVLRDAAIAGRLPYDSLPIFAEVLPGLLQAVRDAATAERAILALRRLKAVRAAFARFSHAQREAFAGRLLPGEGILQNGNEHTAILAGRRREAFLSDPALWQASENERHAANVSAAADRRRQAPDKLADLHGRGIRLEVRDGALRAFPRSALTEADVAMLAEYRAELAAEVEAEWVAA